MTGDWAGSVQILRTVVGCKVSVVVLNDINLIVKIFDHVDHVLYQTQLSEVVTGEPVQHHVA